MNRAQIYHDMTTQELRTEYNNKKQELFNLRFQHSTGQLKNPLVLRQVRRDIARILSILKERDEGLPRTPAKMAKPKAAKPKSDKKGGAA